MKTIEELESEINVLNEKLKSLQENEISKKDLKELRDEVLNLQKSVASIDITTGEKHKLKKKIKRLKERPIFDLFGSDEYEEIEIDESEEN